MGEHFLDITQEHCPMTFVKTRLKMEKLQKGERLEVILKEGEPLVNIPKSSEANGYRVIEITCLDDDIYKVVLEK